MSPRSPENCELIRRSVSLRLDDALSELGQARLRAHLKECASCRAFAERVSQLTHAVRSTPLEPIGRPIVVHRARRRRLDVKALSSLAGAAALLLLVGISLDAADLSSRPVEAERSSPSRPPEWSSAASGKPAASPEVVSEMIILEQTRPWRWTGGDSKPA